MDQPGQLNRIDRIARTPARTEARLALGLALLTGLLAAALASVGLLMLVPGPASVASALAITALAAAREAGREDRCLPRASATYRRLPAGHAGDQRRGRESS